jgi:UDP-N-acetylglucosamine 4,6-dehydratase/5-epimerase
MNSWLAGKRILVTGGTGAFGRRFLRAACEAKCAGVTVFSRDEMKHAALKRELGAIPREVSFVIGDITDPEAVSLAIRDADVVIHAAAMKHLPECESNVAASTRVNVLGTQAVANAFLKSSAEALVFLSTDKSPYASSTYGAQKFLGEKIITETARVSGPGKRAFALRYSNVMDSTGSAFHIFRQLLSTNQKATVNGEQSSRGFVAQSQVVRCLERCLAVARGGEVLVLIPKVVRIAELAQALCKVIGQGEVQVIDAVGFVGEKESATLVMAEEGAVAVEFSEVPEGAVLLDFLGRHPERARYHLPAHGLRLEECERMSGSELEEFVARLL